MTRKAAPHRALLSALTHGLKPLTVSVESSSETPWASATFLGGRHMLDLAVEGPQTEQKDQGPDSPSRP
jgi:hypothetical protein